MFDSLMIVTPGAFALRGFHGHYAWTQIAKVGLFENFRVDKVKEESRYLDISKFKFENKKEENRMALATT